jgi:hypothetical protein
MERRALGWDGCEDLLDKIAGMVGYGAFSREFVLIVADTSKMNKQVSE